MLRHPRASSTTLSLLLALLGLAVPGCWDDDPLDEVTTDGGTTVIPIPETTGSMTTSTTSTVTTDPTSSTEPTGSSSTGSTTDHEPVCGNGEVEDGEVCDDGVNNGTYDGCNEGCMSLGPHCGDGMTTGEEVCDDGVNDGSYNGCNEGCMSFGPRCGDGMTTGEEECDDGNSADLDGCTSACTIERIVFVSNDVYTGNAAGLNGLAGADTICQSLAKNAGLTADGQTFMAWLSAGGKGPATRFPTAVTNAKGPFLLPDDAHTKIADNWKDLTDGALAHPIDIDEAGATMIDSTVWTNTTAQGQPADKGDCSGWTSSMNMDGGIGKTTEAMAEWTDQKVNDCSNSARIYCFQVPL